MHPDEYAEERNRLVERLRRSGDLADPRVIDAFRSVPRHEFLPPSERSYAYHDRALPFGEGQTVSQPTMIAIMLEALACVGEERSLEVGAGSGYAAALLGHLTAEVDAFEIRPGLAERAGKALERLGIHNVTIHVGDGCEGAPDRGPYQRILVSAGAASIPTTLTAQLAPGGRMVIPVGPARGSQVLYIGTRSSTGVTWKTGVTCVFVPLIQSAEA
ncbi:MAG: protein-L-isoaspartate(D-aspartate) O-methyltransferase [Polyangiaceae bacterium]|nr:protein-L-isoaspartate(D-aspartate) O-methyltransferase [Polyangiaceae bacterium]